MFQKCPNCDYDVPFGVDICPQCGNEKDTITQLKTAVDRARKNSELNVPHTVKWQIGFYCLAIMYILKVTDIVDNKLFNDINIFAFGNPEKEKESSENVKNGIFQLRSYLLGKDPNNNQQQLIPPTPAGCEKIQISFLELILLTNQYITLCELLLQNKKELDLWKKIDIGNAIIEKLKEIRVVMKNLWDENGIIAKKLNAGEEL